MLHCKTVWWREGTESCCLLFTLISLWRKSPGERRDLSLPVLIFYPSSQIPHPKTWCFFLPTKKKKTPMRRWQFHPEEPPVSAPYWNSPLQKEPATHPQLQKIYSCSQKAAEVTLGWPSCLGRQEELVPTCRVRRIRGLPGIYSRSRIFAVPFLLCWGFLKT